MGDFKNIADDEMKDIQVTDDLMQKTWKRCAQKRKIPIKRLVATAACGLLIFGLLNQSGLLLRKTPQSEIGNSETGKVEMFSVPGANAPDSGTAGDSALKGIVPNNAAEGGNTPDGLEETMPGQSEASILNEPAREVEWPCRTIEQAAGVFGKELMEPADLPEGFYLETITAYGMELNKADWIVLGYRNGNRSFTITEQKAAEPEVFPNYNEVDVNGTTAYVNAPQVKSEGTGQPNADIHWFANNVNYTVSGLITEEEALLIARAMRPFEQ